MSLFFHSAFRFGIVFVALSCALLRAETLRLDPANDFILRNAGHEASHTLEGDRLQLWGHPAWSPSRGYLNFLSREAVPYEDFEWRVDVRRLLDHPVSFGLFALVRPEDGYEGVWGMTGSGWRAHRLWAGDQTLSAAGRTNHGYPLDEARAKPLVDGTQGYEMETGRWYTLALQARRTGEAARPVRLRWLLYDGEGPDAELLREVNAWPAAIDFSGLLKPGHVGISFIGHNRGRNEAKAANAEIRNLRIVELEPLPEQHAPFPIQGSLSLPELWRIFSGVPLDADAPSASTLASMPQELTVGGETLQSRWVRAKAGHFDFGDIWGAPSTDKAAYVFLELESPREQEVTLGFGADWFLRAWMNGEEVVDATRTGNGASNPSISNHTREVSLREGKNVLAVFFRSGSGGSLLAMGGPDALRELSREAWEPITFVGEISDNPIRNGGFETEEFSQWKRRDLSRSINPPSFFKLNRSTPLAGQGALEVNSLGHSDARQVLYQPVNVDFAELHEIAFESRLIEGDGIVSISLRNAREGNATSFIRAIGAVDTRGGSGESGYNGTYFPDAANSYLVIEVIGEARVLIDDIVLRPVPSSQQYRNWREQRQAVDPEQWNVLDPSVVSPHTVWAKPLNDGPIRVASLLPRWRQRWSLELAQRMDVDLVPVFYRDSHALGEDYWVEGERGPDLFRTERAAIDAINESHPEVIVLGYLNASATPPALAEVITEAVLAGAGLVVLGEPHRQGRGANEPPAAYAGHATWRTLFASATPVAADAAGVLPGPVERAEIDLYQAGAGRIAVVRELAVAVPGDASAYPRSGFEMESSVWARLVRWAAADAALPSVVASATQSGRIAVSREALPGPLELRVNNRSDTADRGELIWWIDDYHGRSAEGGSLPVGAGVDDIVLDLPVLAGGRHWLHWQWVDSQGAVLDWNSALLEVETPNTLTLELNRGTRGYWQAGEDVEGSVRLEGELPESARLQLELRDLDGHLWERSEHAMTLAEVGFRFPLKRAPVLMHRLHATVLDADGGELVSATEDFAVVRDEADQARDFGFQMWAVPWAWGPHDYLGNLVANELRRKQGLSTVTRGSMPINAYNNLRSLPMTGLRFEGGRGNHRQLGSAEAPVRDPALSDPDYRDQARAAIVRETEGRVRYAPLAYELGHEVNLQGYLGRALRGSDVCFAPETIRQFYEEFLPRQYGDIEALNVAWGTDFDAFGPEVRALVLEDAVASGQIPRWIDHRRHMDAQWADFWRMKAAAVHTVDPDGLLVADNLGDHASSYSGIDWDLMFDGLLVGYSGLPVDYLRDFTGADAPRHLMYGRTSFWGPANSSPNHELFEQRIARQVWQNLFNGLRGFSYWASTFSAEPEGVLLQPLAQDLRETENAVWAHGAVERVRDLHPLFFDSERSESGIAVLYSRSSKHAATAWEAVVGRDAAQGLHPSTRAAQWKGLLETNGYGYRAVSSRMLREGILERKDIQLLIMPFAHAIDADAAETIRAFVDGGGRVLADFRPAVYTASGAVPAGGGLLDEVFGLKQDPAWDAFLPQRSELALSEGGAPQSVLIGGALEAVTAEANQYVGVWPVAMKHRYGRGEARLLNFAPSEGTAQVDAWFVGLMRELGVEPLFTVERLGIEIADAYRRSEGRSEGQEAEDMRVVEADDPEFFISGGDGGSDKRRLSRFARPGLDLLGLHPLGGRRGLGEERLRIQLPHEGHVYDLTRRSAYLGKAHEIETSLPLESVGAFAVVSARPDTPKLTLSTEADERSVIYRAEARYLDESAEPGMEQVFRLSLYAPDGEEWRDFGKIAWTQDGVLEGRIELPLNAPSGNWTVHLREAISGASVKAAFLR